MGDIVEHVVSDPSLAIAGFAARSEWKGRGVSPGYELGGQYIPRAHVIRSDEPRELFGDDTAPNPQELLFAALNACMLFGYVTKAAAMGTEVERVVIETRGHLDIRGALGVAPVSPGMESIHYTVRIKARATPAELTELHAAVTATSPNRYHLAQPIRLEPELE